MKSRIKNVKPTDYNNIEFRSKLESDTARILDTLGVKYLYEPYTIELQESFRFRGVLHRNIEYKPDFIIGGNIIVECKGFETPEWKIKRKLLLHRIFVDGCKYFFYETHNQKELFHVLDIHHDVFNVRITCSNGKVYNTLHDMLTDLGLENKETSVIGCITGRIKSVAGYTFEYTTGDQSNLINSDIPFKKIK